MRIGNDMAAGATSDVFTCNEAYCAIHTTGSYETSTLTIEASPDGTNWFTVYTDDPTGTPAAMQFTVTQVPSTSAMYSKLFVAHGLKVRAKTNSTGTTPSIDVYATGTHVF